MQAGDGKEICAGVGSPYTEAGLLDAEKKLAALPANLQVQVGKLPDKARNALIRYPL